MWRILFVRFPIALLIALLVAILFPRVGGNEVLVSPRWALALDQSRSSAGSDAAIGFTFRDRFGYVTPQGSLRYVQPTSYGATFTNERFSLFPPTNRSQAFFDTNGRLIGGFEQPGYPLLSGDRILISAPEGDTLSEWTLGGRKLWERSWGMVIGSVAAGDNLLLVGLLDGRVVILGDDGEQIDELVDTVGRLPVTLATAMAADDQYGAAVVGIDPQRLLLFRLAADTVDIVETITLTSDFRRPLLLQFIADDRWLAYESESGLALVATNSARRFRLPLEGEIRTLAEFAGGYAILTANPDNPQGNHRLQLAVAPADSIASLDFVADDAFLQARSDTLLIGIDGVLLALTIEP